VPTAHYNMGNLLNRMGKPDEAAAAFRRAAALSPDFVEAHANLGAALHLAKRYDNAVAAYRRALEIQPDSAELHHNLGAVYRATGRHDAAAECYRQAVQRAPNRLDFQERLAATLQDLGAYDEAADAFRRVRARAPGSVDAAKGLAEALIGAGKPAEAVALCDEHLAGRGYNSAILCCKAIALGELGEEAAARRIMNFDRFVRPCPIVPPKGFRDVAQFNAAIEQEIREEGSLAFEPAGLATAKGFQTGEMLLDNLRTAEAAGATAFITTPSSADPLGWKALRGSMGSALRLPMARAEMTDTLAALRRRGITTAALVPRGGEPLFAADFTKPSALIVGGEGVGLPADILQQVDRQLSIPMAGAVESLNVGVAAALVLYEAFRQRS